MPPQLKRVKLKSGAVVNVNEAITTEDMTTLDESAYHASGVPRRSVMPKPKTTVAQAAAKKKSGGGSATSKEDSK